MDASAPANPGTTTTPVPRPSAWDACQTGWRTRVAVVSPSAGPSERPTCRVKRRTRSHGAPATSTVTGSYPPLRGQQPALDGLDQRVVVGLGLVGVGAGEPAQCLVDVVRAADVPGDHRRSAGTRVSL